MKRLKPRQYAAAVVAGDMTIDDVPKEIRHWVSAHIRMVAEQIERARREAKP
ncbi:MAG TPA: CD1375 family protein [Gammaproteobacteria bacterium]|nr:CD1375 family protein [Gammaproteobacteria bacterium]